jgi:ribosomal protein S10
MFFYISVSSKTKESLEAFITFVSKIKNPNLIVKYFPKQKIKKFVTVLKSPHINKSAQEQFEYRIFTIKFLISSPQHLKNFYILKKIQKSSFPGINLKIKGLFEKKKQFKFLTNNLNPDYVNVEFFDHAPSLINIKNSYQKIQKYFQIFDIYGELSLKKSAFNRKI